MSGDVSRQHSRSLLSGDLASLSLGNINQQVTLTCALSPNTGAHCYPHTDPAMPLLFMPLHSFSHQHTAPLMSPPLRSQVTSWHPPKGPFSACLSALLLTSLHTLVHIPSSLLFPPFLPLPFFLSPSSPSSFSPCFSACRGQRTTSSVLQALSAMFF